MTPTTSPARAWSRSTRRRRRSTSASPAPGPTCHWQQNRASRRRSSSSGSPTCCRRAPRRSQPRQATDEASAEIKDGLGFFNTALLVFGFISLFVGGFLIFNTFTMLVAQRTRELALLRALGASRKQVTRSVLIESVVVGLLSSIAGFGLGILVAKGLQGLLDAVGISLPKGDHGRRDPHASSCPLVVGTGMTALAALIPARARRSRRTGAGDARVRPGRGPLAATAHDHRRGRARAGRDGAGDRTGPGPAARWSGSAPCSPSSASPLLSPLFARPGCGFLGTPFSRSAAGRIGRGNAMRSPRRTSATAAALMIGLALVAAVSTIGASAKKSVVKIVDSSLGADYVLHADQFMPFSPEVAKALAGQAGARRSRRLPLRPGEDRRREGCDRRPGRQPTCSRSRPQADYRQGVARRHRQGRAGRSPRARRSSSTSRPGTRSTSPGRGPGCSR